MASYPNVNAANKYARDVVAGKIPACKWVRLACGRHLDDLKASEKRAYRFKFDRDAGERAAKFIQLLPHTKGKWARQGLRIKLEPWQLFIVCCLFGWKHKKTGRRRFREAYIEVPRKNGKSVIAAGIGLYMFIADREYGAEVYCGATTEKQAWEVFRPAKIMLQKTPELVEAAGIQINAKTLAKPDDGSRFEPVIGDPGDGSSPNCALIDEYHEHYSDNQYETMQTGMGAREQPLILAITTAGFNIAGPCFEKRKQVQQMLEKAPANDELFGLIYTLDVEDDWRDLKVLRKANPNYGVSVDDEFLAKQLADAIRYPAKQNAFKTKHCNIWCSAKNAWLNMNDWAGCGRPGLNIDDYRGMPCYVGVDLASRSDIAAIALVFRDKDEQGRDRWAVFVRPYLPRGAIERGGVNQAAYELWEHTGRLHITEGEELDFEVIREDLAAIAEAYDVQEIAYDKWRATQLAHQLMKDGANIIEVGGGIATMNAPMREVEAALVSGRLLHADDPCLNWMAGNVVAKEFKGCLTPMKEGNDRKIDGMVAILMAMSRAILADAVEPSLLDRLTDDDILVF